MGSPSETVGLDDVRSLLEGPAPAVLTTYRTEGSAVTSPVWVHWNEDGGALEVVIAEGDPKLANLARDPRCLLVVFEAAPPFRGLEVRGEADLVRHGVEHVRIDNADRYLGPADGPRFVAARKSLPGVLLRLPASDARVWDLSRILP